MQAKEIMSKNLKTISCDSNMVAAANMMKINDIRHLPVTDGSGSIIGMLSDRDIKLSTTVISSETKIESHIYNYRKVSDFMTTPVHKIKETDSLDKVTREMLELKLSCFIVEDANATSIGIITTEDLLIYLMDLLAQEKSVLSKLLKAFRIS